MVWLMDRHVPILLGHAVCGKYNVIFNYPINKASSQ
uniref:Uncharacterized protein n=1 Tax=Anguilla anguilla TaxID=7936 RepID=A0A0E9QPV3_ANGAN